MNVVLSWLGREYEVAVDVGAAATTVGEVAAALVDQNDLEIVVDGQPVDATIPVAELAWRDGSVVELAAAGSHSVRPGERAARSPVVFNRPPRLVAGNGEALLEPPAPQEATREAMRFGWGALIIPVILGLGMAALIHPRMAIFALFSPAMLLANWGEDKRRARRESRESGEAFDRALALFRDEVARAHALESHRLRSQTTSPQALERLAVEVDPRLWERRPSHDDWMSVPIGIGCRPWAPPLRLPPSTEAVRAIAGYTELHDVPVLASLDAGDVVGIAGDRQAALGVANQILLQAAVHHGPADLAISVFTERPEAWDWAKWLPHVLVDGAGRRRVAGAPGEIGEVVALLPDERSEARPLLHLVVADLPDLSSGSRSLIRRAIQGGGQTGVAAVAIAPRPLDLPSLASTIISVEDESSRVRYPDGTCISLDPWVMGASAARRTARALAGIHDPEADLGGTGLPAAVHLATLLGLGKDPAKAIAENWQVPPAGVPIGMAADGPLVVDLVADGPHALLGGTTGAGKSELLRTLVASLASSVSPQRLNLVLVDYKGGSAFDACAELPHTVGVVTDLDDHLARRALICLEAELRYREERLRSVGASDIDGFLQANVGPLPRLLVVVDEFAALALELPEFMDSLVGVAQRGRSLGVHLLLATQRPNGVISENIRANTNLRIALRVQDTGESADLIGSGAAAGISRTQPGRGLVRRGPGDVVAFQTALVTGASRSDQRRQVSARPFVFAPEQPSSGLERSIDPAEPTDLDLIVDATRSVATRLGIEPVRSPWPDALPEISHLSDIPAGGDVGDAPFGLADEPHRQRQVAVTWTPAAGNLLLYGLPGSGTSSALASLAVAVAAATSPDLLHMYVLDFDDQLLHPLCGLPHVGAVVAGNDRERQLRLLRRLGAELQERRLALSEGSTPLAGYPTILTLLDNYGAFADALGDPGDIGIHNLLARLVADGPGVGMMTVISAKHAGDIPTRVASLVASRLVFRLADRYDYTGLGVPVVEPPTMAGRAFEAGSGREVQVALSHKEGLVAAVAENVWQPPQHPPWSIDVLPHDVRIADFVTAGRIASDEWFLPLGIGDSSLVPAGLILRGGDHALITGPARSGKTTALATLASVAKAANPDLHIAAVLARRSALRRSCSVDRFVDPDDIGGLDAAGSAWLVLVDDAELVDDQASLRQLINARESNIRVVAAGAADAIRGLYGHWTQDLRRSRIGCALRPNTLADGDLWQTQLPRLPHQQFPVGRGYLLADGQAELVQLGRA